MNKIESAARAALESKAGKPLVALIYLPLLAAAIIIVGGGVLFLLGKLFG